MNISNVLLFEGDKCVFMLHHTYCEYPLWVYSAPTFRVRFHTCGLINAGCKTQTLGGSDPQGVNFISFSVFHGSGQDMNFLLCQQGFGFVTEAVKPGESLGNTREILLHGIITGNDLSQFSF